MFIKLTDLTGEPFYISIERIENFGNQYVSTIENNFPVKESAEEIFQAIKANIVPISVDIPSDDDIHRKYMTEGISGKSLEWK